MYMPCVGEGRFSQSASCSVACLACILTAILSVWPVCRISPPRFLAECRKRRLSQGSFVSAVRLVVCFLWFVFCLCVYFCDLYWVFPYCLFVSNSQVIGCEDRLRNDLYCVGWGVKLYLIQSNNSHCPGQRGLVSHLLWFSVFSHLYPRWTLHTFLFEVSRSGCSLGTPDPAQFSLTVMTRSFEAVVFGGESLVLSSSSSVYVPKIMKIGWEYTKLLQWKKLFIDPLGMWCMYVDIVVCLTLYVL